MQEPGNIAAMQGQLAAYEIVPQDAINISENNEEKDYMRTLIGQVEEKLAQREAS